MYRTNQSCPLGELGVKNVAGSGELEEGSWKQNGELIFSSVFRLRIAKGKRLKANSKITN